MKENRETFFKRLPGLTAEDRFLLEFAYDIAKEGHGYMEQTRDGGERYFEHPRQVALILIDVFKLKGSRVLCSALMHDLPEDVPIWSIPGRVTKVFGDSIGARVHALSKPDETKFANKEECLRFYFNYQLKEAGWQVCLIKIADRIHNLRTMSSGKWTPERKRAYINETNDYFWGLVDVVMQRSPAKGSLAKKTLQEAIDGVGIQEVNAV